MTVSINAQDKIYSQFIDKDHYDIVKYFDDFKLQFNVEFQDIIYGYLNIDSNKCLKWIVDILGRQVNLFREPNESDSDFKTRIKKKRVISWVQPNVNDWYKFALNLLNPVPDLVRVYTSNGSTGIFHNSTDISSLNEYYSNKIRNGGSALYMPYIGMTNAIYGDLEELTLVDDCNCVFSSDLVTLINSTSTEKVMFEYAVFAQEDEDPPVVTPECVISKIEFVAGESHCNVLVNLENYDSDNLVTYWDDALTQAGNTVRVKIYNDITEKYYIDFQMVNLQFNHSKHIMFRFLMKETDTDLTFAQKNLYEYDHESIVNETAVLNEFYTDNKLESVIL